jgi:hypothetical protein
MKATHETRRTEDSCTYYPDRQSVRRVLTFHLQLRPLTPQGNAPRSRKERKEMHPINFINSKKILGALCGLAVNDSQPAR